MTTWRVACEHRNDRGRYRSRTEHDSREAAWVHAQAMSADKTVWKITVSAFDADTFRQMPEELGFWYPPSAPIRRGDTHQGEG